MEDDIEKFNFYLQAKFEFYEDILFSNLVRKPLIAEINKLKNEMKKYEMEKFYNHFHLAAYF